MSKNRIRKKALAAWAAVAVLALPGSGESRSRSRISIDGSSTVFLITEAVAEEFQIAKKGAVMITVGIKGTGGGFKRFCRGETDIQNASRPMTAQEMKDCREAGVKYFELPVAFDAMAVVVNPKNDWVKSITVEDLKKIWRPEAQGKIMTWKQIRPEWPDLPLKLYGAGADSGTFDYFTEAIVGKAKASRGDYTASEDDNTLVLGVSSDRNALGYIPYAYYEPNKSRLKIVPVDGGPKAPKKGPVAPTEESVIDGTYYPLARPIFIYVSEKSAQRPEVKEFVEFYMKTGAAMAREVKYVPLPGKAYDAAIGLFRRGRVGTAFNGEPAIGLKIEDLLKREASL